MRDWAATIHEMVQKSSWESQVEEWEEDGQEYRITCTMSDGSTVKIWGEDGLNHYIAYTLFDGSTLTVWEDGRYEHCNANNTISVGIL